MILVLDFCESWKMWRFRMKSFVETMQFQTPTVYVEDL